MPRPDFIIIGAMKCATSTLHEQLNAQAGVFMSEPKEPNFFSDDDVYARGGAWYASLFAAAQADERCGESSTHYTKLPTYPRTVERLKSHFSASHDVRFVYVMRHPIERLCSQFIHEWSQRNVHADIERAIVQMPEMVAYSEYGMQVTPYLDAFGPERVMPVFFEHLHRDPAEVLLRVGRFLGLPSAPRWDESVGAQNVSSQRMRRSALRDRLVNAPGVRQLRERLVPRAWRDRVKSFWMMKNRPELSVSTRDRMAERFDRDFEMLTSWLGFPISCSHYRASIDAWWDSPHADQAQEHAA